ncbi:hypothetical protein EPO04_02065 [Patescibacteria group bacterium]|nr:MAG: hypothetical protein EPO04_02065 [Patescibacteria group bacterium]
MKLDDQFYQDIGYGQATEEQKLELAAQLSEVVQNRVALKLSDLLSEEQLKQLDEAVEDGDEAVFKKLAELYPAYPELVRAETDAVKAELHFGAQEVLDQSQNKALEK